MHLILVLLGAVATLPISLAQYMGPYKYVEIHKFLQCDDISSKTMTIYLEPKKDQDDSVKGYGFWNTTVEIGSNMEVDVNIWRWATTSWARFYVIAEPDFCAMMEKMTPEIMKFVIKSFGKEEYECLIPAGSNQVEGFPFKFLPFKNFPKLPEGKFKCRVLFKHEARDHGCLEAEFTVWPEDNKKVPVGG